MRTGSDNVRVRPWLKRYVHHSAIKTVCSILYQSKTWHTHSSVHTQKGKSTLSRRRRRPVISNLKTFLPALSLSARNSKVVRPPEEEILYREYINTILVWHYMTIDDDGVQNKNSTIEICIGVCVGFT